MVERFPLVHTFEYRVESHAELFGRYGDLAALAGDGASRNVSGSEFADVQRGEVAGDVTALVGVDRTSFAVGTAAGEAYIEVEKILTVTPVQVVVQQVSRRVVVGKFSIPVAGHAQ